MGLMYEVLALVALVLAVLEFLTPAIRLLEDRLPDEVGPVA